MSLPAVALAGPVFVTARSAEPLTVAVVEELLLAGLLSGVVAVTVAVLVMVEPGASEARAITVTKMTSDWPAASVGMVQLIVWPTPQAVDGPPGANVRLLNVTLAGRASVSVTV